MAKCNVAHLEYYFNQITGRFDLTNRHLSRAWEELEFARENLQQLVIAYRRVLEADVERERHSKQSKY